MKNKLRAIPLVLSCLLLAAHFLRLGYALLCPLALAVPFLLLVPGPAVVRVLQGVLVVSTFEWLRTTAVLTWQRMAVGAPVGRMLLIMGAVALFTALSTLPLQGLARARGWNLGTHSQGDLDD